MSEANRKQGQYLWAAGDLETREWFEEQWRIWPERADEGPTTNLLWSTPRAPMHPVLGRRPSLPAAAPQPLTKRQKRRMKGKRP